MPIRLAVAFALMGSLAACSSILEENPVDELPIDRAISDAEGARAALAGAYNVLQSGSYYGGDFTFFNDLIADNAVHTGTFTSYALADANQLRADNATVYDIWAAIYDGINRVNNILQKVPALTDLEEAEKNQILGEAHALRGLHYHNLVKLYGDVPLVLEPPTSVEEASEIVRSPVADVYAQIRADLSAAEGLVTETSPSTRVTVGAVDALQARVALYQGDYATAVAEADEVLSQDYTLAATYPELFPEDVPETPEDILKVTFTAQQFTLIGFYYNLDEGRGELAPSQSLIDAYDPADERLAWSILGTEEGSASGVKFPTTIGAEDFHIIRLAEVILIRAEALARQDDLAGAVDAYNLIRERAGLTPHTLGTEVTTQEEVLAAIDLERRLELAMEGDRWADLVRTGRAVEVMGIPEFQALFPIPQQEIEVAPGLTQNPGY
jgi:starch-binding outer membrane protein, SusD/RagB family